MNNIKEHFTKTGFLSFVGKLEESSDFLALLPENLEELRAEEEDIEAIYAAVRVLEKLRTQCQEEFDSRHDLG